MDSTCAVLKALRFGYASIGYPAAVMVGLSGGADSVALLVCLCELRKEFSIRLTAVHVNHGLRENASSDEAFCVQLCRRLDVELAVERIHIPEKSNVEAIARERRYAAFEAAMQRARAQVLALGHHADDQAETVLMHLLYGAGAAGLGGMKAFHEGVWRPFLSVRRSQLQAYLQERNCDWREDESNTDTRYTRNRIRAQLMPALEAVSPEAVSAIGKAAQILQDENTFMDELADGWMEQYASGSECPFLLVQPLLREYPALQRRIVRRYVQRMGATLDFVQTERVRGLLSEPSGTIENLPGGLRAMKSHTRLHLITQEKHSPSLGEMHFTALDASSDVLSQLIPLSQTHDLQLRTRRTGDYIQPFGMQGTKPLKEYLIDHAMDRPFRDDWPLVCRGSEVLWVIGVGASEKLRVCAQDTTAKRMIYTGDLPDRIGGGNRNG